MHRVQNLTVPSPQVHKWRYFCAHGFCFWVSGISFCLINYKQHKLFTTQLWLATEKKWLHVSFVLFSTYLKTNFVLRKNFALWHKLWVPYIPTEGRLYRTVSRKFSLRAFAQADGQCVSAYWEVPPNRECPLGCRRFLLNCSRPPQIDQSCSSSFSHLVIWDVLICMRKLWCADVVAEDGNFRCLHVSLEALRKKSPFHVLMTHIHRRQVKNVFSFAHVGLLL